MSITGNKLNTKEFLINDDVGVTPFDFNNTIKCESKSLNVEYCVTNQNSFCYSIQYLIYVGRLLATFKRTAYMRTYYCTPERIQKKREKDRFYTSKDNPSRQKYLQRKREYYQEHKEHVKLYQKEYNSKNFDYVAKRKHNYYIENKDAVKKWYSGYYNEHRDQLLQYQKTYNENNQEKLKIRRKKYYDNVMKKRLPEFAERRANKFIEWTLKEPFNGVCSCCGKKTNYYSKNREDKPEFHHTIPENKKYSIYEMICKRKTDDEIWDEIHHGGVVLLCYKCHRVISAQQQEKPKESVDAAINLYLNDTDESLENVGRIFGMRGTTLKKHLVKRGLSNYIRSNKKNIQQK